MRRSVLTALFLTMLFIATGDALDDIQGVTAVWNDFVSSIRRGDYRRAHALFSPQSRAVLPYLDFVAEYGPLSAAREMVLANPDSQSTSLDADWAELAYGGSSPATGRKFRVGVAFSRNSGVWGLVAARNEPRERIEAGARALLARLWENRSLASPRELLAAMEAAQSGNPVLRHYRMEWDGSRFQAFSREEGLRTFYVDVEGAVKSIELPNESTPEATVSPAEVETASAPQEMARPLVDEVEMSEPVDRGMPELSEPPPSAFSFDLDEEIPEPPLPVVPGRLAPAARPTVSLPDVIK